MMPRFLPDAAGAPFRLPPKGKKRLHLRGYQELAVDEGVVERFGAISVTRREEELAFYIPEHKRKLSSQVGQK